MPSARPPTRWPTGSRRGDDKRPPRRSASSSQRDARSHALGAFDEQYRCDGRTDVQRRHPPQLLVADADSLATGGQESSRSPRLRGSPRPGPRRLSTTCSQLSNTKSRDRPSRAEATESLTVLPGCWVIPNTAATASGTAAGSATAANSKTHTPSRNSSANRAATSNASRVLPTPPTPVNVTSRCDRTAACDLGNLRFAADQARDRRTQVAGIRRRLPAAAESP